MIRKDLLDSIAELASIFASQVKMQAAMNYHGISIHAEDAFIPILNIVYDLELKNTNDIERNHPAIDLVDLRKGAAFQVTANNSRAKIVETLKSFVAKEFYINYPSLYIFILKEKRNYKTSGFQEIVSGRFTFEPNEHIIDLNDLLRKIRFIESVDVLQQLHALFEALSTSNKANLTFDPARQQYAAGKSFNERVKAELAEIIGVENVGKLPELQGLFLRLSWLDDQLSQKESELKNCETELRKYYADERLYKVLAAACESLKQACDNISKEIKLQKQYITDLSANIKCQKDFLDKIEYEQASNRMKLAKQLFQEGKYDQVEHILNYEGRQEDINNKIKEKERQWEELKSLSDEETFLALNAWSRQNWIENIDTIRFHFEQSIALAGYGWNSYQYAIFLERIGEMEKVFDCLYKTLYQIPDDELENKANVLLRLGKLLRDTQREEAKKNLGQAVDILQKKFNENEKDKDDDDIRISLADASFEYGTLCYLEGDLEMCRSFLESSMILLGTRYDRHADEYTQRLSYCLLIALGSLHQRLGNNDQVFSYQQMALYMGAVITLQDPDHDMYYLEEAVSRLRAMLGDEVDGLHSEIIYKYALKHFVHIEKWQTQEDIINNGLALNKLGFRLMAKKEYKGASICFKGALKLFKVLDKRGVTSKSNIAESLYLLSNIHMVNNEVKIRKRLLLEAIAIYKDLAVVEPIKNMMNMLAALNQLYVNSFIAVPPKMYSKGYQFFDEALKICKELTDSYDEEVYDQWLQLIHHKAVFITNDMDKSGIDLWLREFVQLIDRIVQSETDNYRDTIDEIWDVISPCLAFIVKPETDHPLKNRIIMELTETYSNLYEKEPEKYNERLKMMLWSIGKTMLETSHYSQAADYLEKLIEIMKVAGDLEKDMINPANKLAESYKGIKKYGAAAEQYIFILNQFESGLVPDNANDIVILNILIVISLAEDGQVNLANSYVEKAKIALSMLTEQLEKERLENILKEVVKELSAIKNTRME